MGMNLKALGELPRLYPMEAEQLLSKAQAIGLSRKATARAPGKRLIFISG
jgi:hypothetical protein